MFDFSGLSAAFNLYNLSRGPLRYWGSFWLFHISDVFVGGSKVSWGTEWIFPRKLVWRNPFRSYWWYLLLFLDSFFHPVAIVCRSFCGIILSLGSSYVKGSKVFGGTDFWWRVMSLEVFSLPYGIFVPWRRWYIGVILYSLWKGFFCCFRIFSCSAEEERLRYKQTKNKVRLALSLLVTYSSCHIVT